LTTIAVGVGVLEWTPLVTVGLATGLLLAVSLTVALLRSRGRDAGDGRERLPVWHVSVCAVGTVLGFWALLSFSPPLALLVVIVASLTSPPVLGRVRRAVRSPRRPGAESTHPLLSVGEPDQRPEPSLGPMDDRALCRAWRESFWDLQRQTTTTGALRVVAFRQCCLDELERRDAAALHAWLGHGPRASSGPERYWSSLSDGGIEAL
jgi:hypothetical protein